MTSPRSSRAFWTAAVLAAVLAAGFTTWMALNVGGDSVSTAVDDITELLAALVAAVLCAVTARRRRATRLGWGSLGLGALCWAIGQSWYVVDEVLRGRDVPSPGWNDLFFLAFVPFSAVGLLSFLQSPTGRRAQLRSLVDALLLAGGGFLCSWPILVEPLLHNASAPVLDQVISVLYPAGDLLLIGLVVFALARSGGARTATLWMVGSGLVALSVADSGFTYLTQVKDVQNATDIAIGWVGGFLLLALAALRELTVAPSPHSGRTHRQLIGFLPYAFVLAGVSVAVTSVVVRGSLDNVSLGLSAGLLLLLLANQWSAVRDSDGLTAHLEGLVAERTAQLEEHSRRHRALVRNSSDVLTLVDADLRVIYQSPSGTRLHHLDTDHVAGLAVSDVIPTDDPSLLAAAVARVLRQPERPVSIETTYSSESGVRTVLDTTVTNLLDEAGLHGVLLTTHDVTERVLLQEELTRRAFHDVLTGLPNRAMLREKTEQALRAITAGGQGGVGMLVLDIDSFKSVNDTLGHPAGDAMLIEAARRLSGSIRTNDTVVRLGGDEFAVLLEDVVSTDEAKLLGERLLSELGPFVEIEGRQLRIAASAGVVVTTNGATSVDDLLRDADLAMYTAKAESKGQVSVFDPQIQKLQTERLELMSDLRDAAGDGQLVLQYQPVVDLRTQETLGAEALVRWRHPERGLLPPLEFIPLAEDSGLIIPIGRWVLEQACLQAAMWQQDEKRFSISVNVSARQLYDPEFPDDVTRCLALSGLPADALVLELTESVLLDDTVAAAERLSTLKAMGIRIAIDDFGTGYSSMSYLHQLPLDILKIDRSFVSGVADGGQQAAVTRAVVDLARGLGLVSVAEGVETLEQLAALEALMCDSAQGYFFARPLDADILSAQLEAHAAALL